MGYSKKPKQIMSSSKLVALGLLESVAALAYLCANYTRKTSQKIIRKTLKPRNRNQILGRRRDDDDKDKDKDFGEESFGDGGLWQRSILMGDKCEPLDFSGVIYYDSNGKMLSEPPMKSPRASPFPGYSYRTAQNC